MRDSVALDDRRLCPPQRRSSRHRVRRGSGGDRSIEPPGAGLATAPDDHTCSMATRGAALGLCDGGLRDRLSLARAFLGVHPDLDAWMARPLPARLTDLRRIRAWPLLCYLALEGAIRLDIDLLLAKNQGGFGLTAERYWPADFEQARGVATRLGWAPNWTRDVVRECLPLVLVWSGKQCTGSVRPTSTVSVRRSKASPAATRWTRRN